MSLSIDTSIRSPNWSEREGERIDMIVLHATAGRFAGDIATLTDNRRPLAQRVSAHYYITKAGKIYQLVDESKAAWHAGASVWQGKGNINQRSIGIELENLNDGRDPYPIEQFEAAVALTRMLMERYRITSDNVVRHADIALPPGRKSDPRNFPWIAFQSALDDEQRWREWGDAFPLPREARSFGIPQYWFRQGGGRVFGQARSHHLYVAPNAAGEHELVLIVFQRGIIYGFQRDGSYAAITWKRTLP